MAIADTIATAEGNAVATHFQESLLQLGVGDAWEQKNGSWWITPTPADVRALTALLLARNARFITATVFPLPEGGEFQLDYHWDYEGQLITIRFQTSGGSFDSIADMTPAADWFERETREYYAIEFHGRTTTKPLMLRENDPIGVNIRKDGKE